MGLMVVCHQNHSLAECLSDEHSDEGIRVVFGQAPGACRVTPVDG